MSDQRKNFPVGHPCAGIIPPNKQCEFRRPEAMTDAEGKKIKIIGVTKKFLNLIEESGSKG